MMVSVPFLWCRRRGEDPEEYGISWRVSRHNFAECFVATVVILASLTVISLNWPGEYLPRRLPMRNALDLASSGIAAAVIEEIFFRGWLQPMFRKTMGAVASIVLTSAIFAASHVFVARAVFIFAVFFPGCVMGILRERHGNIATSTLFHASGNLWAVWFVPLNFPALQELIGKLSSWG
ncbi:MAG: CPBP family intramembrane metalloprotease [Synergistaceae bacterium]|nr:CPBP family intramembrane metalloprotease [Synergistaceae bacterium]